MNRRHVTAGLLIAIACAALAHGHGTPIHVEVQSNQLVVSQGLPDSVGFASMIYVEEDEDGDPFGEFTLQPFGPVIVWQIPGFDISGMDNESSLSIEVLLRPVANSSPVEQRTLWYWNDQTDLVEPAPAASAMHLLARNNLSTSLTPADLVAPPPLLLSATMTGQQGFHNHGLLSYALDNDPPPPVGAYGFFARLTSNTHLPSDPFLIVINNGVDYAQMTASALAINAKAVDPAAQIPGDYDGNGQVQSNDYQFWRARFEPLSRNSRLLTAMEMESSMRGITSFGGTPLDHPEVVQSNRRRYPSPRQQFPVQSCWLASIDGGAPAACHLDTPAEFTYAIRVAKPFG